MGKDPRIEEVKEDFRFRYNFFENVKGNWNYILVVQLKMNLKGLVNICISAFRWCSVKG